ncbi:MAG TPA: hypothetical protein VJN43_23040 [Bryobacteraceae bacterium]|nr:hypothetical protein [Bryobacteraceae bacterium]
MTAARNMNDVVKALERRYGHVELIPEDGLTKIAVAGLRLAFPEAEKLARGKVTIEELRGATRGQ